MKSLIRLALVTFLLLGSTAVFAADKKPAAAPAPTGSVAVFGTCNNSNGPCTAQATCPASKAISTGTAFYIVPDGTGPAFGICGTASTSCQPGSSSCVITSASSVCGTPGWSRQIVEVAISCK